MVEIDSQQWTGPPEEERSGPTKEKILLVQKIFDLVFLIMYAIGLFFLFANVEQAEKIRGTGVFLMICSVFHLFFSDLFSRGFVITSIADLHINRGKNEPDAKFRSRILGKIQTRFSPWHYLRYIPGFFGIFLWMEAAKVSRHGSQLLSTLKAAL